MSATAVPQAGTWFSAQKLAGYGVAAVVAVLVLTIIGTFMRGPFWNFYWPWESWPELPRKL